MPAGHRQRRRVVIGVALIAVMAAAAILIFYLDTLVRASQSTYSIVGVFYEAPRLRVGSPVRVAGYPAGQVTRIELLPPGAEEVPPFAATLQLPTRLQAEVRRDSRIRLQRQRLMGEPLVELTPGTAVSPILQPGDTLRAEPPLRASELMAMARAVRRSIDTLMEEEKVLRARSRPLIPDAERLRAGLNEVRGEFQRFERDLREGPLTAFLQDSTDRETLRRAAMLAGEIADLARARAATPDEARFGPIFESIVRRAAALEEEVERLRALLEEPRGFPGRWERDPALREAIAATRAHLDSLIEVTRRRPWRYFF